MRLRPVEHASEPQYPDYDGFHQNRREFLRRMSLIAGALLSGAGMPGCRKEPVQRLGGKTAAPTPPPKSAESPPVPLRPESSLIPDERIRGRVVAPSPGRKPPDPGIAGGMDPPGDDLVFPDEERVPEGQPPPDDAPK